MAKLKPCKACQKEVAKSAKKCPHCGQKLKMGFLTKGIIGFAVLFIIAAVASGGEEESPKPASTTPESEETKPASTAPVSGESKQAEKEEKSLTNEGVSSDVTIKVGPVETREKVGNEFINQAAQGVFKVVEVSLTNNQKDAITINGTSFKLVDDKGREFTYSTDGQTAFDIGENNGDSKFFLQSLNPGLTMTGKIVFDIPADAKGLIMKASGGMMGEEIELKVE